MGSSGDCASARTRSLKRSHDSSRLMNKRGSSSEGVVAAASGVAGLVATAADAVGNIGGGAGAVAGLLIVAGTAVSRAESGPRSGERLRGALLSVGSVGSGGTLVGVTCDGAGAAAGGTGTGARAPPRALAASSRLL